MFAAFNYNILTLLTFVAAVLAVGGVYSIISDLFLRDRSRINQRVDEEFRAIQREQVKKSPLFKNIGKVDADLPEGIEPSPSLAERLENMVVQSGLNFPPRMVVLSGSGIGVALGLVCILFIGWEAGLIGMFAGLASPFFYVNLARKRRIEKLLSQLPDAFELMSRIMRAGRTMSQALQSVADEFQPPVASEFAYCFEQQNLGLPPDLAYQELARRTGLLEIKIFTLAVLVQRQTGGNLPEVLEKLGGIVRERFKIRNKIRILTAAGRMEAVILVALPFVVFGLIFLINSEYARELFEYPKLIIAMIVSMVFGALWIRKIINFEY